MELNRQRKQQQHSLMQGKNAKSAAHSLSFDFRGSPRSLRKQGWPRLPLSVLHSAEPHRLQGGERLGPNAVTPQYPGVARCHPTARWGPSAGPLHHPDVCEPSAAGQGLFAIFFSTASTKTQTFRQTDPSLPPGCF